MKQLRERSGLSQSELAQKLGLTQSAIAKWDQGRAFPRLMPSEMFALIEALNCTWKELIEAQANWETIKAATND